MPQPLLTASVNQLSLSQVRNPSKLMDPDDYSKVSSNHQFEESTNWPMISVAERFRRHLAFRRQLLPYFNAATPAWAILIELYISGGRQQKMSITDVGIAAEIAPTSALRWQNYLVEMNLASRSHDEADKRRMWLDLTASGRQTVESMLVDLQSLLTAE